jgi:hypothetical protein
MWMTTLLFPSAPASSCSPPYPPSSPQYSHKHTDFLLLPHNACINTHTHPPTHTPTHTHTPTPTPHRTRAPPHLANLLRRPHTRLVGAGARGQAPLLRRRLARGVGQHGRGAKFLCSISFRQTPGSSRNASSSRTVTRTTGGGRQSLRLWRGSAPSAAGQMRWLQHGRESPGGGAASNCDVRPDGQRGRKQRH